MLKRLAIHNIVLVSHQEVEFFEGLHILTGETGAGKTSFIQAFQLALGAKADETLIKTGEDSAYIEATFDISQNQTFKQLVDDAGISLDENNELIIKRQLTRSGKNRAFINAQATTLITLQQLASHLVESIGYKALDDLRLMERQRDYLDLFADLQSDKEQYRRAYTLAADAQKEIQKLADDINNKDRELAYLERRLNQIETISPQEGEDEQLEEEYTQLLKATTIQEQVQTLYENTESILGQLKSLSPPLDKLQEHLPTINHLLEHLNKSTVELEEIDYTLRETIGAHTPNPERLEYIEERLSQIRALLKQYNGDIPQLLEEKKALKSQIEYFENLDYTKEKLELDQKEKHQRAKELANSLSQKRILAAEQFATKIQEQLPTLNLPDAKFLIKVEEQDLTIHGADQVTFTFSANRGSPLHPIQNVASGGEMSRLLLIVKILLANRSAIPLLIFDEIDANIGGETASLVGKRLATLATQRQIFAITHFPQVASHATHHLGVSKTQGETIASCTIKHLDAKGRKSELLRMMGGTAEQNRLIHNI